MEMREREREREKREERKRTNRHDEGELMDERAVVQDGQDPNLRELMHLFVF